jgi:xylulose-5-phosphate/fructose-6-phosphate phosphoketolase
VWRQDHNGFSHQDPGFIDVVEQEGAVVRVYLPPDANTLLSVTDHCLRSRNYVNVIVAGKQPAPQWLDMDAAVKHCTGGHRHLGVGQQRPGRRARCRDGLRGDVPTSKPSPRSPAAPPSAQAEGARRQRRRPDDAAAVERAPARPERQGLRRPLHLSTSRSSSRITAIPWLIHRLTYRRTNHTTCTCAASRKRAPHPRRSTWWCMNDLDRFHLALDVLDRVKIPGARAAAARNLLRDKLIAHKRYIAEHGEDMPEIRDWTWSARG